MLRTLNYHKCNLSVYANIPFIDSKTFETRSTTSINDHSLFYTNEKKLRTYLTKKRSIVTWSSPLFQQVTSLIVYLPLIPSSLWNNLINIGKNKILFLITIICYHILMNLIVLFLILFFQLTFVKYLAMMMMHNSVLLIFHILFIYPM
jgi:hypothetical protein